MLLSSFRLSLGGDCEEAWDDTERFFSTGACRGALEAMNRHQSLQHLHKGTHSDVNCCGRKFPAGLVGQNTLPFAVHSQFPKQYRDPRPTHFSWGAPAAVLGLVDLGDEASETS